MFASKVLSLNMYVLFLFNFLNISDYFYSVLGHNALLHKSSFILKAFCILHFHLPSLLDQKMCVS